MDHKMWCHLPLLVRSSSKDSVEFILQTLWKSRTSGLDSHNRELIREMLQLPSISDLDPLLVCLRILIRQAVHTRKDDIQNLFPDEVLPEIKRLLTLLLQKFQKSWQEDISKDQQEESMPKLKALNNKRNVNCEAKKDVRFQLASHTFEATLKSMTS